MDDIKGVPDAYDTLFEAIQENGKSFYEPIKFKQDTDEFVYGQICEAPVWYEKSKRWYLESENFDINDESNSTWKIKEFIGTNTNHQHEDSGYSPEDVMYWMPWPNPPTG